MTEYARTEQQQYSNQPYNAYNNQVNQNWESNNMPAQEMQSYDQAAASTSASQARNWNGTTYAQNTYQTNGQNGISSGYSASLSEQPSTNHINVHRNIPNGISVNTSNLPIGSANVISTDAGRIICVADVRGNISQLNELAKETGAIAVIHSGDFGFYEESSLARISDKTLKHLVTYSTIIRPQLRNKLLHNSTSPQELRSVIIESSEPLLSEFPLFRDEKKKLDVPLYTVWGACEDVVVLEKFRTGEYKVHNLNILDEANTYVIDIGGVSLRLFGLGGAIVHHKLFDNGEGSATIAGGHGTMWTTILQIGELVDTAQKVYDPTETRVLVTHGSPGREGLLAQLSVVLRADFTISAGLHFRYGISYNEFSVQSDQANFCAKLESSRKCFHEMWQSVKNQVEGCINESQRILLQNAFTVVDRVPSTNREEPTFKNMWNFNLPDAAFGWVLLDIKEGRVSAEIKAQGFNFAYRRAPAINPITGAPQGTLIGVPTSPSPMDRQSRRNPSQWQPSPALVPQQSHIGAAPSPILAPQSSSPTQTTPPSEISNWKSWNNESSSPSNEGSTSQKIITNIDNPKHVPSKVAGSDVSSSSQTDTIATTNSNNDTANTTVSENINNNQINGSGESDSNWAEQTQQDNWKQSDLNEPNQAQTNSSLISEEGPSSTQNRNQYNNRRANTKNQFSVYFGKIAPGVNEDDIKEFFTQSNYNFQIVKVRLARDRENNQRDFAYVDFGDATSLDNAIQLSGQTFGQHPIKINKIEDRSYDNRSSRGRGRGRGRGGYGNNHRGYRGGHGNNPHNNNGGNMQNGQ
ncbi:hypothetical protein RclHR1_06640004 [Rhizophagus clarus]|uniref:Ser/Thr protein phosphatase family protein n=1 Tax=Rhizophagus clarus TaxID=94130 RepID=A0A2Z6RT12_9GLOM|nr:hypothetical protein RclHR1_06640004 [Rhizophagus clarus]GET00785.1 Ser/Thr protein phosphatase family protein [Rhizophagus clarus]